MNARDIAAALGDRAEEVCRRYLPHGRKQGRYWVAGDIDGARGRSFFVRLHGPGTPGKWTDAADGSHGDLLDIIRHRSHAPTLRAALDEARRFLAMPPLPALGSDATWDSCEAARRLWQRCQAIDGSHAERYLQARGLARCRFAALRFHPELRYRDGCWVPEYSDLKRRVCPTFPADSFFSDSGAIRDGFSSPSRVFQVATLSGQEQYQAASFGAARSRPAAFACLPVFPAGGTPQMA